MNFLDALNPQQKDAVVATEGPVLVLAGAGSGKTRVLTHKVAFILEQGLAKPYEVMAVTFTNKAAGELRNRIDGLIGGNFADMWVGTFHSLFARILRRFANKIDYQPNFAIYDREDQEKVVKEVLQENSLIANNITHKNLINIISSIKGKLKQPEEYQLEFRYSQNDIPALYRAYEKKIKVYNALDFDDLLYKPLKLFHKHPEVAEIYQDRFKYILVDEFQDTNIAQNELILTLSAKHRNITVVGDDDQAIYGWRGAEVGNILHFNDTYPDAKVFRLERNYRSTPHILRAAQAVIEYNLGRHRKNLWTEKKEGDLPVLISAYDEREEAVAVASVIQDLLIVGHRRNDFALLYRTNAQSRSLENALREANIPYTIVGGLKFYQRKEIKDILAYLKLLINPSDAVSFNRVVNFPPRGIGAKTIEALVSFARKRELSIWGALSNLSEADEIKGGAKKKLEDFARLIANLMLKAKNASFSDLVSAVIELSGMMVHYKSEGDIEAQSRLENLQEFLSAVQEYERSYPERGLEDFLQETALVSEVDEWKEGDVVSMMTVHCSKGLEFPVVFITGLEEGLFPLMRDGKADFEEERRLFYVGATRAMNRLYLTFAKRRREGLFSDTSRFITEIPRRMLEYWKGFGRVSSLSLPSSLVKPDGFAKAEKQASQITKAKTLFKRGDLVVHPQFGEGVVYSIEKRGEEDLLTIYFQGYGAKRIFPNKAHLTKITL